jgi:hypothetical protein
MQAADSLIANGVAKKLEWRDVNRLFDLWKYPIFESISSNISNGLSKNRCNTAIIPSRLT